MTPDLPPVFRFAPSPNGFLHLGHALSALMNAGRAKAAGGRPLLSPGQHSSAPTARGRDAESRWATARSGKRVANQASLAFLFIVLLATPIAHDPFPP